MAAVRDVGAMTKHDNSERGEIRKERRSHISVEEEKSAKARYIRVAAIDIVSSDGIRNIYFEERCEKSEPSCDHGD